MRPLVVLHYSELGLKGGNRPLFEQKLRREIKRVLSPWKGQVHLSQARLWAFLDPGADRPAVVEVLEKVFGLAWFSWGFSVERTEESLRNAAHKLLEENKTAKTFALAAKRLDKRFSLTSEQICRRLGDSLRQKTGLNVDLDAPDIKITIDVFEK